MKFSKQWQRMLGICLVSCLVLTGCHTTVSKKLPASVSKQTDKVQEDKKTEKLNQAEKDKNANSEKTTKENIAEKSSSDAVEEKPKVSDSKKENSSVKTPSKEEKPEPQKRTQTAKTPTTATSKPAMEEEKQQTVTMSIIGADGHVIFSKQEVDWNEGDTVIDVLLRVTKAHKIQMEYSGGKKAAYVEGIDNLYEFDKGEGSGWMYSVNGVYVQVSCGSCSVKKGDVISWRYTKNLGEDLGAKTE